MSLDANHLSTKSEAVNTVSRNNLDIASGVWSTCFFLEWSIVAQEDACSRGIFSKCLTKSRLFGSVCSITMITDVVVSGSHD